MPTVRLGPLSITCKPADRQKVAARLAFREQQWKTFEDALEFDWADQVLGIVGRHRGPIERAAVLEKLGPNAQGDTLLWLKRCVRDIKRSCRVAGFTEYALIRDFWYSNRIWYEAGPLFEEWWEVGEWWTTL